jgi:hypothetical protein
MHVSIGTVHSFNGNLGQGNTSGAIISSGLDVEGVRTLMAEMRQYAGELVKTGANVESLQESGWAPRGYDPRSLPRTTARAHVPTTQKAHAMFHGLASGVLALPGVPGQRTISKSCPHRYASAPAARRAASSMCASSIPAGGRPTGPGECHQKRNLRPTLNVTDAFTLS